jgi:hypothetical protein
VNDCCGTCFNWSSSAARLWMECADNTEIAVHDAGQRASSFMYYHLQINF